MAKVYPFRPSSPSSCFSSNKRETFTIWMKSLVANGNGYTVYNSNGEVVYRIDNYESKCSNEVYLMDLRGKVLCTILKKKLLRFGLWDGFKSDGPKVKNEKPWFQVRNKCKFLKRDSAYHVIVGCDEAQSSGYKIEGLAGKSDFKIIDSEGRIVAEIKQKKSSSGVVLRDVLSISVEPLADHSFIMALVAVFGLISRKM